MKIKETIGIDVSKLTLDVVIHSNKEHLKCENTVKGFKKLVEWCYEKSTFKEADILFIFEHTGMYSHRLASYLSENNIPFSMVPGLEIKRSLGISRGKDDKVDARAIARYAYRLRDEIKLYNLPSKKLTSLKTLLSLRDNKVKQRAGDKALLKEYKLVYPQKENKVMFSTLETSIKNINNLIAKLEAEIMGIL